MHGVPDLAQSIQFNHEWTRIDTNKDGPEPAWRSRRRRSPSGEGLTERRNVLFTPSNSCLFVSIRGFKPHRYGFSPEARPNGCGLGPERTRNRLKLKPGLRNVQG